MQAPVPLHDPLHPLNVEPAVGLAVSVTAVPTGKPAAQVLPQSIPAGLLVTLPPPVPILLIVSVVGAALKVAEIV